VPLPRSAGGSLLEDAERKLAMRYRFEDAVSSRVSANDWRNHGTCGITLQKPSSHMQS
jgi:hypothetical protein